MRFVASTVVTVATIVVVVVTVMALDILRGGLSARAEPSRFEAAVARRLRLLAIPAGARTATNPVPFSDEELSAALDHYADHCAICHGPTGDGQTTIGRGLFPKVPDLRAAGTQELTNGELFFIIHNGVRYTAMPGWGVGDPAGDTDSWQLVHAIRRLPNLTAEELERIERSAAGGAHEHEHEHGHAHAH